MNRNLKKVELWLSKETALPIQQQFTEPSGDYLIARYLDMKPGPQHDSVFRIVAKGSKTVRPGQN
jgi:outer membrane lipoprotein-sorting protein